MIVVLIHTIPTASSVIRSAYTLSSSLKKEFAIVYSPAEKADQSDDPSSALQALLQALNIEPGKVSVKLNALDTLEELCLSMEVSFLFIQLTNPTFRSIKKNLKACRELRIPYLLYKDSFSELMIDKVLVPVNFLIEEIEKAQFAAAFGRFCRAEITLLQAKDYGTKAATNVAKIASVLDKFELPYKQIKGSKDSYKIEYDALQWADNNNYDLIIASASRAYGLDDVVFGPKELHLIKKTNTPLMLINPRADLYTLCD